MYTRIYRKYIIEYCVLYNLLSGHMIIVHSSTHTHNIIILFFSVNVGFKLLLTVNNCRLVPIKYYGKDRYYCFITRSN